MTNVYESLFFAQRRKERLISEQSDIDSAIALLNHKLETVEGQRVAVQFVRCTEDANIVTKCDAVLKFFHEDVILSVLMTAYDRPSADWIWMDKPAFGANKMAYAADETVLKSLRHAWKNVGTMVIHFRTSVRQYCVDLKVALPPG